MQTTAVPNTLYPNLDHHVQEIIEQGYTVVPNVLSSDEVREINEIIDAIFDKEKTIADERNWHNATFRVAYMLPQKHPLFRTLPFNPRVLPLMQAVLGNRCILSSLNALTMSPGGITQKLHRDHGDPTPGVTMTINALQTLDAFTRENGATRVIPGTHNDLATPPKDTSNWESRTVTLEAPAGSLIAFNGALFHAGSANTTTNLRRCLHAYYARAWVRPQWDYPASLTSDVAETLTVEQKKLFGYYPPSQRYDVSTDRVIFPRPPGDR